MATDFSIYDWFDRLDEDTVPQYPYTLGQGTRYGVQLWPSGEPMSWDDQYMNNMGPQVVAMLNEFMRTGVAPTGGTPIPAAPAAGGAAVPGTNPPAVDPYIAATQRLHSRRDPPRNEGGEGSNSMIWPLPVAYANMSNGQDAYNDDLELIQRRAQETLAMGPQPGSGTGQADIEAAVNAAIEGLKAKGLLNNPNFDTQLNDSKERARLDVAAEARRRGLDYTPMHDDVMTQLDRIAMSIPKNTTDFNQFYGPGIGGRLLDEEQSYRRGGAMSSVNDLFRPGFESRFLSDTTDDATADSIYNEQYNRARTLLDNSLKRGNLNDTGYNTALEGLERQGTSARSRLGELGTSLLGKYRTNLTNLGSEARTAASGLTLGQGFSIDPYRQRLDRGLDEARIGLSGELRSAAGEDLFDIGTLLGQAGGQQGSVPGGSGGSPLFAALNTRNRKYNPRRGVGSEGAF